MHPLATAVGVVGLHDVEHIRSRSVFGVTSWCEHPFAVGAGSGLSHGVAVHVVTQLVGHLHLRAIDRSVLGVVDLDLERDGVTEFGEPSVVRRLDRDGWTGVARHNGHVACRGRA